MSESGGRNVVLVMAMVLRAMCVLVEVDIASETRVGVENVACGIRATSLCR